MALLPSLPQIDVYIAFNPTEGDTNLLAAPTQALPSPGESNDYWTDISAAADITFVRSFTTQAGKQHYLDQVEATTLTMKVNNRTGFFMNGGDAPGNGTGYVLDSRQPIAITATWDDVTYPVFWGITDQCVESFDDQLNSDIQITASDLLEQLSLKELQSISFWPSYAQSTSAAHWYRCSVSQTAVVTSVSGNGTTVTYTAFNNFTAGDNITVTGLGKLSGKSLNLQEVTIATVTSSGFTVTNATVGVSQGTGSAYRIAMLDQIGSDNGDFLGAVSFPQYGVVIYDTDTCVDLGAGTSGPTGYCRLPAFDSTQGGIDFWIVGQDIANTTLMIVNQGGGGDVTIWLGVDATGHLIAYTPLIASVTSSIIVNDGYPHHVGLVNNSDGELQLYCDYTFTGLGALGTIDGWETVSGENLLIGILTQSSNTSTSVNVDEIVISNTSSPSTLIEEVKNRYTAGTLLQLPTNPSQDSVLSGDRIAEILCLAGFGTITGGQVVLNEDTYYINDSGTAWAKGTSGNGLIDVGPFYFDTPITTSTPLDLIQQVTDSDIGSFFQKDDGTFAFYNQLYYGTWDWGGSSGTWTPSYTTPTGNAVWTDDGSSDYPYIPSSCQPTRDAADVWMLVQVTPQAGVVQTYENVDGEPRWGFSTLTKTATLHATLNAALSTAWFLGYLFRSPLPRFQAIALGSTTKNGTNNPAFLARALGDVVTAKRTSPNASTSGTYPASRGQIDSDFVIESKTIDFDAEGGTLIGTFVLDPYPIRT